MKDQLNISVVINTYNRAENLKITLESLFHQTFNCFEVIVVNGPSTDNTEEILEEYAGRIKAVKCPVRNLSVSRNLGIEAAAGDVVAFIDDDAIADPNWIQDLVDGYDDIEIGGVGGLVYDYTGMELQYRFSACDRIGNTDFNIMPPFTEYNIPYAEKFLYLQGTNCSFRKSCLVEIGGFDEEFEYYLDEVDVCMRIIDLGYKIKPLEKAIVHHKYKKSFLRNEEKIVLHPYSTVKNKYYFGIKNNKTKNLDKVIYALNLWKEEVISGGKWNTVNKKMTQEELEVYLKEVEEACADGQKRGNEKPKTRKILSQNEDSFLKFQTVKRDGRILKICYLSKEYPPENFGGIGRYTYDLATTFAAKGHEVHVITEGKNQDTVDFEDGVWVHRLVSRLYEPFKNMVLGWNFSLQARNYFELERIQSQGQIDIVNGPIWLSESGMANCSGKYSTVLTLMTTQKIINDLTEMPFEDSHPYKLMKLEECSIGQHKDIHAISKSIMEGCKDSMQEGVNAFIAPLGCRDLSKEYISHKDANRIVVYSVGRLEHRKGTDLLLQAAEKILSDETYNNVLFMLAGKETTNTLSGISYKEEFIKRNEQNKFILEHVRFLGEVTEAELMQNYADADIVCMPSRYESFGIVLLEGMSFRNAIVAARVGGMKDILQDEETGLFFEKDDIDGLTRQLKKLIDDKIYRNKIADAAREEYVRKYSLEAVYMTLYKKYLEIAESHPYENHFDVEKYAQMIATSENIDLEMAKQSVNELLKKGELLYQVDETVQVPQVSLGRKLLKKIYKIYKKISPSSAVKMRNRWFHFCYFWQEMRTSWTIRKIISKLYRKIIHIPVLGIGVRYIADSLLMPIRIEKSNQMIEQQQNNDELLRQIGNIVGNYAGRTMDVVWKVESQTRVLDTIIKESEERALKLSQQYNNNCEQLSCILEKQIKLQEKLDGLLNDLIMDKMALLPDQLEQVFQAEEELQMQIKDDTLYYKKQLSEQKEFLKEINIKIQKGISEQQEHDNQLVQYMTDTQKNVQYNVENYSNIVFDRLNNRLNDVRSEILFEFLRNSQLKRVLTEAISPRIINKEKVEGFIVAQNIRLNLGSGHICFDDYINIDEREINNIDIVADVRNLPFEETTVDEMYASHLIEHFPKDEFVHSLLPYWITLLKPQGKIQVILPDLEAMIKHYNSQTYKIEDMREVLYGLQEYPGDIHYALYGYAELKQIFENCGLIAAYSFTERKNGKCYDMCLIGEKCNVDKE